MSRCDGSLNGIRQNGKASIYLSSTKCTAWIMNVEGTGNKETLTCAFIPCFPQRALPLAVKVGETDRSVCECDLRGSRGYLLFTLLEDVQLIIRTAQNQTSRE